MDGQYPPPIPPLGSFYPTGPNPSMYPSEGFQQPRLHQLQTISMESLGGGGYSDYDDPNRVMLPPQGQQRQRRRQLPGSEHVKHRRTRSGCYTCRQRRVKCDETHPICDRCRKGKRECAYPGTPTSATSTRPSRGSKTKDSVHDSASDQSGDEYDLDDNDLLPAIPDDEDDEDEGNAESEPPSAVSEGNKGLPTPVSASSKTISPKVEAAAPPQRPATRPPPSRSSSSRHFSKTSISHSSRWTNLPQNVKAYLRYHRDALSHHHYAFKYDGGNFLKTTFQEIAINDDSEALLYAVVAFSAYHHCINPETNGTKISTFLGYYNKSISLLQQSLTKKRHSVTTLLTILQLATIEEFLGDWVNLLGHQRAAHQILTDLFTPTTIMQDETRRKVISWYIRFDIFAGMMSGGETMLGREWFAACAEYYKRAARDRPDELGTQFEGYFATSRLLATDIALTFAAKTKNTISDEQFATEIAKLTEQFESFGNQIENRFLDPSCFVKSFPNAPPPSDDDITDFREPGYFYGGDYFAMNFVLIDFWAIQLMFKYQLSMAQRQPVPPELTIISLRKAKMFQAVEVYDKGPRGAVLGCQASLGIASLFLPKEKKYTDWCRKRYALIEQHGYIYPATLRKRMSEVWGEDVTHWWLPNDEGYPEIIRSIRDFIEYRARMPADAWGEDVRDMNGIFRALQVSDQEPDFQSIPDDLKGTGTDSDAFDAAMEGPMYWESSPENQWTQ